MAPRNRTEGWKHAKNSGHENEERIKHRLMTDRVFQSNFLMRLALNRRRIVEVSGGGRSESHVPSVFESGELTKPKADIYIKLDNGEKLTFSIKKSLAGQVYFVTIENFLKAYETHYASIPETVKRGISLYWGSAYDTNDIIRRFGTKKKYEKLKHRVVAETLRKYDAALHGEFLQWFVDNSDNLADFCFACGGIKNPQDWVQFVWYKNELEGEVDPDKIFKIADLCQAVKDQAHQYTLFGRRNGGSTIWLPFGHVQWHSPQKTIPGGLQFHHKLEKLERILPSQ